MHNKKFSHFIFLITFSISLIIVMPLIVFNTNKHFDNAILKLHTDGVRKLHNQMEQIKDNLSTITNYSKSLSKVIGNLNEYNEIKIANLFQQLFVKELGVFQLRLLSADGMELIRYELNKDNVLVNSLSLQDKSTRYYYKEAQALSPSELYISKLDLNVENLKIEKPYKKTIRVVQKVKIDGKIFYIVMNYNLSKILKTILTTTLYDLFFVEEDNQINMHLDDRYSFSKQRNKNLYQKDFLDKDHQYITQKSLNILPYDVVISIKKTNLQALEDKKINTMKKMFIFTMLIAFIISSLLYYFLEKYLKRLSINVSDIMEARHYKKENQFVEFKAILSDVTLQRQMIEDNIQALKKQEKFTHSILNSQSNFVFITDGEYLHEANKPLLNFLNFNSLSEFHEKNSCICDFFVARDGYLIKEQNGKTWFNIVLEDIKKQYKVMMKDIDGNEHIFQLFTNNLNDGKGNFVMSLSNITELTILQNSLQVKVDQQLGSLRAKDQQLLQQSRLAQMGEMISMIAHQWRQPLGAISATSIDMNLKLQLNEFDLAQEVERNKCNDYVINHLGKIDGFVQSLTNTIDDFRNFYKPNKTSISSLMNSPVKKALNIVRSSFVAEGIEIFEEYTCSNRVAMHENELMQVILNILKNSQDNFKEKSIKNGKIWIKTYDLDDGIRLEISDNGGGVSEEILQKIFDPYFSTKSEKNGTGLGLYMSKIIIELHHEGKLYAKNRDHGVCFFIDLKMQQDKLIEKDAIIT